MSSRAASCRVTTFLALLPLLVACGSSSTGTGSEPVDFSGRWSVEAVTVGKRLCSGELGELDTYTLEIAQRDGVATLLLENSFAPLSLRASRATGSFTVEGRRYDLDLSVENGRLVGTQTLFDERTDCTQVWSLSGTRTSSALSAAFAGDWNFEITVTDSRCSGSTIGAVDEPCWRIQTRSNTIWIDDAEGTFLGIGDGNSARIHRYTADRFYHVELELSGPTISGTLYAWDVDATCDVQASVSATKRQAPCGEPESPADFGGFWSYDGEEITNSCGFLIGPECSLFVQDGNRVTIDGEGLVGAVAGNTLTIHAEEPLSATVTLGVDFVIELSSDGNSFTGTRSITIEDSADPENDCETVTSVSGVRSVIDCRDDSPGR